MSQSSFSFNMRNSDFPMLSELQPRTTIIDSQGELKTKEDRPAVAYCHNVMPTAYGMKSVGYSEIVPAINLPVGHKFLDVRIIFSKQKNFMYLGWDSAGNIYCILPNTKVWTLVTVVRLSSSSPAPDFASNLITIGNARSVSYIMQSKLACFTFDETTVTLNEIELFGLAMDKVIGLVGSYGYLVAYTDTSISWSSTILPNDFEPSGISGAGGGEVSDIGGKILFAVPTNDGFLLYAESNIVASIYTNNAIYPFKFSTVPNSNGGISLDYVAYETNVGTQVAFTKGGLQTVTSQGAKTEYPEITDFLSGRRMETVEDSTLQLIIYDLPNDERMKKKVKTVAGRYVVISYGLPTGNFTHAIVIDVALSKLGKLKFEHTDVFEFISDQTEAAKETLCFVSPNGKISIVNTALTAAGVGLLLLGRLQYSSSRVMQLQEVELEDVQVGASLALYNCPSLEGKVWEAKSVSPSFIGDGIRRFNLRDTAINHNLLIKGTFNLVSVLVKYVIGGRR